jgi:hypothetical protein
MIPALIAACAAVIYGGIAWIVGDRFPFSRYSMYADVGGRQEGAVLVVRVGGREVDFHEVVAWKGVDPARIEPFSVPCSLHWVVFEAQRWISEHAGEATMELEIGYRILRVEPDGTFSERFVERARGWGRLR